jgi:hypothetical protein
MPTRLWRFLALTGALLALCLALADALSFPYLSDDHINVSPADGHTFGLLRVDAVDGTPDQTGGIQVGDLIAPVGKMTLRQRLSADVAGTTHNWIVHRGTQPAFIAQTRTTQFEPNDMVINEIFNVVRVAMILIAMLVALRRPEDSVARALVTFLVVLAAVMVPGGDWLPDWALASWRVLRYPLQVFAFSQALVFACTFPARATGGLRAAIYRINPWYTLLSAALGLAEASYVRITGSYPPLPSALIDAVSWMPLAYFPLLIVAFTIGVRTATGSERVRAYWASGAIGIGFTGPLLQVILVLFFHRTNDPYLPYLPLSLIALPIGLAYTILRHRTVDVGFVISRALVLTIMSFALIAIFGLIERAIGKLFIDASHIASRSVEIALALGLGFSLRTLHSRIERIVDRVFFRNRQLALSALRTFADDVYHITDPDVAIERTVDIAGRYTDAENAALYLIADGVFGRAAAQHDADLPAEIDADDPLFVRMRSSRHGEFVHAVGSAVPAEVAFPMFVRGTLVGALVLAPKRSGEAYDPEESALLGDLAQRVGLALDALQTLALRRELDALMATR